MKALVITLPTEPETADPNDMHVCLSTLDALGISIGRASVGNLPSSAVVNSYDFIVFPQTKAGYDGIINNATITIPIFALFASAGSAGFGSTPGVSGTRSGLADRWLDVPFTDQAFVAAYGGSYTLTDGKALATVSATEPNVNAVFAGAAQTNAGQVFAWRTATAGGNFLYVSAHDPNNGGYLPFLIQEAINDGVIDKPPRRAPLSVDLDHINGQYAHAEPALIDKIASYVPEGGVLWCGYFNANVAYFDNMSAAVLSRLKKYSGNKFKYCWHTHVKNITSGTYPNITELVNKVTQETDYLADRAVWEGLGLEHHYPAYYNPGSNMWTESSMALFTADTSITADGGDAVTQQGFGFRVFRSTRQSERAAPQKTLLRHNQHAYKHTAHGILILATWDMSYGSEPFPNLDMPYNAIADWRKNFNWLCNAISTGMTLYLHDEDFETTTTAQDPGIEQHGFVQMQIIAEAGEYLKDVVKAFADPVDYHPDLSISMA